MHFPPVKGAFLQSWNELPLSLGGGHHSHLSSLAIFHILSIKGVCEERGVRLEGQLSFSKKGTLGREENTAEDGQDRFHLGNPLWSSKYQE